MVFTMIGYSESQDNAALVNVAAIVDDHVTVTADDILVPKKTNMLAGVMGLGLNITLGRVSSPSLEAFNLIDVAPLNVAAEPISNTPWMPLFDSPIPLQVNESLRFLAAEDGAGAQRSTGILWLMDKIEPLPTANGLKLPIRTIRYTGSTTLVANTWSDVAITGAGTIQTLKAGRYAHVGLRAITATGIAARVKYVGEQVDNRPGCIAYDAVEDFENPLFRMGRLGVWGEFEHNQLPLIQVLATAGDTTQEFLLDVIKIA